MNQKDFIIDRNTPVLFSTAEGDAVTRTFYDFRNDWYMVFGREPLSLTAIPENYSGNMIVIGSLNGLFLDKPEGCECYDIRVNGKCLHLSGSDELGLIYAIYTFSEKVLGVDPWYFWNDFLPKRRGEITLDVNFVLSHGEPSFKYRGFFINNEDMLTGSFRDPINQNMMSPHHFDKICELILRLHGNTIAPGTRVYPDESIRDLASARGLYVNDHHVTPLGLNVYKWPEDIPYSYVTHPEVLEEMWKKCVDAQKHRKMLWTVSFRGKGDGPFWHVDPAAPEGDKERADVINRAVAKQVEFIREVQPDADIIFNMYNEQAELCRKGFLKIPEGVIRVWPNDGAGVMSDGGMAAEGDGAYFHITACRNRLSEAVSPARVYSELGRFQENGANACMIMNVGNIRTFPISISAAMDFVYDSTPYLQDTPDRTMDQYILSYARKHYDQYAEEAADIYCRFFRCSNFRRPEEGKAPFGYGESCLRMYPGMFCASYNQVLTEFRQSIYMHELARKFIRVLKDGEVFNDIWDKTVDDFNSVLEEDTAYLPELLEEARALCNKAPERSRALCSANIVTQIEVIHSANTAMRFEGLSVKAFMADNTALAREYMENAMQNIDNVYEALHRAEGIKWPVWFQYECLACYSHTCDLMRCVISLLDGKGEILVRPFVDFVGHGRRVSYYQGLEENNRNYPLLK